MISEKNNEISDKVISNYNLMELKIYHAFGGQISFMKAYISTEVYNYNYIFCVVL